MSPGRFSRLSITSSGASLRLEVRNEIYATRSLSHVTVVTSRVALFVFQIFQGLRALVVYVAAAGTASGDCDAVGTSHHQAHHS